ncbi:MAG TPA: S9 family peptidase [Bryobacteraceae bacterium]|nr:S9 family peptidase [Bryobacteraceae bacterium]
MRIRPAVALLFVFSVAVEARPIRAEDVFALEDLGEIQVSPGGGTVVFTVSTRDVKANRVTTRLVQVPAAGGAAAPVPGAPEGVSSVRWSPDGSRLAFLAHDALWVLRLGDAKPVRVCAYQHSNAFLSQAGNMLAWSPDGRQLAFAGTLDPVPPPADPLVITRMQYKTRTAMWDGRRTHLYVVPAGGGTPRAITSGRFDEHSIDWGGDGAEIVFLSNHEPEPDARLNYDIFAVNVATGAVRQITRTPGVEMNPAVSPDGRWIAYNATKRDLTTIDSVAEDAHIWVAPFAGGAARELNADLDRRCGAPQWTPGSRGLIYTASDRGKTVIFRTPLAGGRTVALVDREAQAGPVSVSAKDGALWFGMTDPAAPKEIFRLAAGGGQPQPITSLNAAVVRDWDLVKPETLRFRSFDGAEVEGWLYPAQGATRLAPLLLSIHGGPHGMHGYAFNPGYQYGATRGYATLAINPRGSSGYGQKFSDGCVNDWGGGDYQDLMAGVDYALRTHANLDGNRLGVMGGSYGGFMTNWVITQTQRFKAAVAIASLSNLISFYATSLYQDLVHTEFRGFPWDDDNFARLWHWSPLRGVRNVTTPTLFLHGESDNDVHITQAEEMYTALRRRGIETELVRYPREGHGFHEPKHQFDSMQRELAWMDRFLKPRQ